MPYAHFDPWQLDAGKLLPLDVHIYSKEHMRKVPEITILFWCIKLLTTALGEVLSDYLVFHVNQYLAVIAGFIGLLLALFLQFRMKQYIPWVYWFAAAMVAVFGTMAADIVHIVLGIPYVISSMFFCLALVITFLLWYRVERTLSIHSIRTFRRELFYWATVMVTFALGTAVGDMSASNLKLGYFASGILFLILILLPVAAYFRYKANEVLCFWLAYILTRPLGASFADWIGKPQSAGGLGVGTGIVSVFLIFLIVCLVAYCSFAKNELSSELGNK